tara:strand:+ start:1557 stop:1706 length:150 start_codon:yes stop_codon:yes gene_type:complete
VKDLLANGESNYHIFQLNRNPKTKTILKPFGVGLRNNLTHLIKGAIKFI